MGTPSRRISGMLALAMLAASGSVHAEGEEAVRTLSFATGCFDVAQRHDPALEARLEYRMGRRGRPLRALVVAASTGNSSAFLGVGVGYELLLGGRWVVTPTFAPGYYRKGNGTDLGYPLEFRSQLEVGYQFGRGQRLLIAISHMSNASLGHGNPGEESLTLAWSVPLAGQRAH